MRITRALEIVEAADVVDDRERRDVVEERVDREVAAERVLLRRAECVVAVDAVRSPVGRARRRGPLRRAVSASQARRARRGGQAVALRNVATSIVFCAEPDVRETEAAADDPAVPEQPLDLIRMGVRADVEVLRPPPEQQVAHAAADEVAPGDSWLWSR